MSFLRLLTCCLVIQLSFFVDARADLQGLCLKHYNDFVQELTSKRSASGAAAITAAGFALPATLGTLAVGLYAGTTPTSDRCVAGVEARPCQWEEGNCECPPGFERPTNNELIKTLVGFSAAAASLYSVCGIMCIRYGSFYSPIEDAQNVVSLLKDVTSFPHHETWRLEQFQSQVNLDVRMNSNLDQIRTQLLTLLNSNEGLCTYDEESYLITSLPLNYTQIVEKVKQQLLASVVDTAQTPSAPDPKERFEIESLQTHP